MHPDSDDPDPSAKIYPPPKQYSQLVVVCNERPLVNPKWKFYRNHWVLLRGAKEERTILNLLENADQLARNEREREWVKEAGKELFSACWDWYSNYLLWYPGNKDVAAAMDVILEAFPEFQYDNEGDREGGTKGGTPYSFSLPQGGASSRGHTRVGSGSTDLLSWSKSRWEGEIGGVSDLVGGLDQIHISGRSISNWST